MSKPPSYVIAFTPGEPAGIGPDLAIHLSQQIDELDKLQPGLAIVCIADPEMMTQRAGLLGLDFNAKLWDRENPGSGFFMAPLTTGTRVMAGQLNTENSRYVIATLDHAINGCLNKEYDALVTGPVHKGIINDADIPFTGHTEYLADHCGAHTVVMMLACETMRVALATTHVAINEVSRQISQEKLERIITVLHRDLTTHFAIDNPVISVCGLNPHAGEGGHLGVEEIDSIIPALDKLRRQGITVLGPLPADTAFTPRALAGVDVVLAMYHDQGLPVIKHACFGNSVNITLGLPFIRTSVDHGTALDLAGKGQCNVGSAMAAVHYAINMTRA